MQYNSDRNMSAHTVQSSEPGYRSFNLNEAQSYNKPRTRRGHLPNNLHRLAQGREDCTSGRAAYQ